MDVHVRTVSPARGWAWIAGGVLLFLRSPGQWLVLLLILYAAKKVLSVFPVLLLAALFSVLAVLLMPVFMAGLMDGCRALAEGRKLKITHLLQGFRHNSANLVTIGGISLIGNLIIVTIFAKMGGDAMAVMAKALQSNPTPQVTEQMQTAFSTIARAALVGSTLSLPLLMALWFAPLLVYFDDVRPLQALKLSLVACLKNTLPMLVYGLVALAGLIILVPIGIRLKEFDLALWLLAPVLVPSIYASYVDIFSTDQAAAPDSTVPG